MRRIETNRRDKITNNNSNIDNRRYQEPPQSLRNKREEKRRRNETKTFGEQISSGKWSWVHIRLVKLCVHTNTIPNEMWPPVLRFLYLPFFRLVFWWRRRRKKIEKKKDCNKEMNTLGFVQLVYIPSVCIILISQVRITLISLQNNQTKLI